MNIVKAALGYVERMVKEVAGLKMLLLDYETAGIISSVVPHSYLLENEVYLTDYISDNAREELKCLNCICFLRPSSDSIEEIVKELKQPKYKSYHIYFSNVLRQSFIERLAEADQNEMVQDVQEFFLDFYPFNAIQYDIGGQQDDSLIIGDQMNAWNARSLVRSAEGIVSLLLALRKRPIFRYDRNSLMASRLAHEVKDIILKDVNSGNGIFDFRQADTNPVLIVLDRRSDLISPLLLQWSYEAMIHDIFGIKNGRLNISRNNFCTTTLNSSTDEKEFALSEEHDRFFSENMHIDYGSLNSKLNALVLEYRDRNKQHQTSINDLANMKKFIEEYPEFKKVSTRVAKHSAIVLEIGRIVNESHLLDASEAEQRIVMASDATIAMHVLQNILNEGNLSHKLKYKVAIIFAIRWAHSSNFNFIQFIELLGTVGITAEELSLLDFIIKYVMIDAKSYLHREDSIREIERTLNPKSPIIHRPVETIFQQHVPPLIAIIDQLSKGLLPKSRYPEIQATAATNLHLKEHKRRSPMEDQSQDIIVFIVGGSSCEESLYIKQYIMANPHIRVVLGGNGVCNYDRIISSISSIKKHLATKA